MLSTYTATASVILGLAGHVAAWGVMGHQTVASVATHYLQPAALTAVNKILTADPQKTTTTPTMISVATWADDYRYTTAGSYSAPFHYVDALDSPPSSCSVVYTRDCTGTGCVISAIGNYTHIVQESSPTNTYRAQALKYIIHFLGDITQPLHDENYEVGGNDIAVLWDGASTNLHHIWDTEMITELAGTNTTADINAWTNKIVGEVSSGGKYASSVASWISCITPSSIATAKATETCATTWAVDANAYVCSYVLNPSPANKECDGAYYTGAAPIIEQQIAKGGVRLAAWLNMIYTGETGF